MRKSEEWKSSAKRDETNQSLLFAKAREAGEEEEEEGEEEEEAD